MMMEQVEKNMGRILLMFMIWLAPGTLSMAQTDAGITWWNPATTKVQVIEGQGWAEGLENPYDRLPASDQERVRPPVWNLSHHSAGLVIRFQSNASRIIVRYQVEGALNMNHMPSTGVSGVDLYVRNPDGEWLWAAGKFSFRDTIRYDFDGIITDPKIPEEGREYYLYLPLYNRVTWMEIGVPDGSKLKPLPVRSEKPIVAYGTSILQGGCASRPGMAWSALLGRMLDRPIINLGFSGNGRLEAPLIERMTEIDAAAYILDCLPNLSNRDIYSNKEVMDRLKAAVRQIRAVRPKTPIILVDHGGYPDGAIIGVREIEYIQVNQSNYLAYYELLDEGIIRLYRLAQDDIGLSINMTVDGTHPNDLGMVQYARAYGKLLKKILQ